MQRKCPTCGRVLDDLDRGRVVTALSVPSAAGRPTSAAGSTAPTGSARRSPRRTSTRDVRRGRRRRRRRRDEDDPMTETTREDDVQELVRSIHAERQAAKDKERREGWTKYVSLMIVVLAVATGIGALKAGGFGSRVMLTQAQASDTWAFYQAKSIKQRLAEMEARGDDRRGGGARRGGRDSLPRRREGSAVEGGAARSGARRGGQARPAARVRHRGPADRDRARLRLPHHQAQAAVGRLGPARRDRPLLPDLRPLLRLAARERLRVQQARHPREPARGVVRHRRDRGARDLVDTPGADGGDLAPERASRRAPAAPTLLSA